MATVEVKGNLPALQCLSTDVPPSAENGTPLHHVDTGDVFIRHDGGWEKDWRMARAIKDAQSL